MRRTKIGYAQIQNRIIFVRDGSTRNDAEKYSVRTRRRHLSRFVLKMSRLSTDAPLRRHFDHKCTREERNGGANQHNCESLCITTVFVKERCALPGKLVMLPRTLGCLEGSFNRINILFPSGGILPRRPDSWRTVLCSNLKRVTSLPLEIHKYKTPRSFISIFVFLILLFLLYSLNVHFERNKLSK